jgi:SpoVK/Ycf46/Vps4 family AAA+-type ATPase
MNINNKVAQNVLNTILYHTGSQSRVFMLVLATNRPEDLDEALLDRMDEVSQYVYVCVCVFVLRLKRKEMKPN